MSQRPMHSMTQSASLADVLERVLDKGIVIAGDIKIKLVDIELLTVQIRLMICSVDKAAEVGMDWWRTEPYLASGARQLAEENRTLRERLEALEARVGSPPRREGGDTEEDRPERSPPGSSIGKRG